MTALTIRSGRLSLKKVRDTIRQPADHFLTKEEAVCFVLWALSLEDQYATGMMHLLKGEYRGLKLSDTILYAALNCLEEEESPKVVERYQGERKEGEKKRGRPTEMFRLVGQSKEVNECIDFWIASFSDRRIENPEQN